MKILSEIVLVFEKTETRDSKPFILTKEVKVLAKDAGTFSSYYYLNDKGRDMQLSTNFEIDKTLLLQEYGYELHYVIHENVKYRIKNILKVKDTYLKVLLDVERE